MIICCKKKKKKHVSNKDQIASPEKTLGSKLLKIKLNYVK